MPSNRTFTILHCNFAGSILCSIQALGVEMITRGLFLYVKQLATVSLNYSNRTVTFE